VYRVADKPSRWLTLGEYSDLGLADARARVLDHKRAVKIDRTDPAAERRTARAAAQHPPAVAAAPVVFTFADLAKLYAAFAKGKKKTWRDDVAKINCYLLPAWGELPLRAITRTHVHELLDTLVAQDMTVGVNRIQAVISRLFTVALDRSLVDAHPAARMIKRFTERRRARADARRDPHVVAWARGAAHRPRGRRDAPARAARAARHRDGGHALVRWIWRRRCGSCRVPHEERAAARGAVAAHRARAAHATPARPRRRRGARVSRSQAK
jgi:hypothetical protein